MPQVNVIPEIPEIPWSGCYGCKGTGTIQGWGQHHGNPCPCSTCFECGNPADHTDEGRSLCQECHPNEVTDVP